MKKLKIFLLLLLAAMLVTGCSEEAIPEGSTVIYQ